MPALSRQKELHLIAHNLQRDQMLYFLALDGESGTLAPWTTAPLKAGLSFIYLKTGKFHFKERLSLLYLLSYSVLEESLAAKIRADNSPLSFSLTLEEMFEKLE